ncbi:MAG: class II aldolase/adducin family protein [Actinobacteria bacterium]|nr:class II aldolase/adducin family protein [Actinomycetota bacterium]
MVPRRLTLGRRIRRGSTASRAARREVLDGARALAESGLVVGTVGNVSRRVGSRMIITPSRVPFLRLRPHDLVVVDLDGGAVLAGALRPSIETPLHLSAYRNRADIEALVHTHSPAATAWSYLAEPLLPTTEENEYYAIGPIATSPPAPAGSSLLAEAAVTAMGASAAVLLGRHGVLAAGPSVEAALEIAAVVERQAEIAWFLRGDGAQRYM